MVERTNPCIGRHETLQYHIYYLMPRVTYYHYVSDPNVPYWPHELVQLSPLWSDCIPREPYIYYGIRPRLEVIILNV